MFGSIRPLVRQRVDAMSALKWALLLGVIYGVTQNLSLILGLLTGVVVIETVDILELHPGVDERWVKVGLGGFLLVVSGVWLWSSLQEPPSISHWLPVVAIAGSVWVLLDARADFVQGRQLDGRRFHTPEPDDDLSASEVMLLTQHAHLVGKALREEPKTVAELAVACDLTESRVREAIQIVGDGGTIYSVDSALDDPRYALDEGNMGASGVGRLAVGVATSFGRRLLRPFVDQF